MAEHPDRDGRFIQALRRWAARRCHAIVSVCDAMTEQALAAGVGRPAMYRTVYSGMDVEAFLNPEILGHKAGIHTLEPYQRGKIPVVFVHGLFSSPLTWARAITATSQ